VLTRDRGLLKRSGHARLRGPFDQRARPGPGGRPELPPARADRALHALSEVQRRPRGGGRRVDRGSARAENPRELRPISPVHPMRLALLGGLAPRASRGGRAGRFSRVRRAPGRAPRPG
jgi:hypothetical protein